MVREGERGPFALSGIKKRGRGQRVLDRLTSTDDFTYKDTLSLDGRTLSLADRKLILFLIVALVNEDGALTTTYRAVLRKWATVPGHWAYGKDVAYLQKACGKYLGKSAEQRPPWPKILDTPRAGVREEHFPTVLALTAGLFCQAKNIPEIRDYDGPIMLPAWGDPQIETVTVDTIRVSLQEAIQRPTPDLVAGLERPAPTRPGKTFDSSAALRQMIDSLIRAFRIRDHEYEVRHHLGHDRSQAATISAMADQVARHLGQSRADAVDPQQQLIAELQGRIRALETENAELHERNAALTDQVASAVGGLLQVIRRDALDPPIPSNTPTKTP